MPSVLPRNWTFVYIAYVDDSGSTASNLEDRQAPFQVITAVIIKDSSFDAFEGFHANMPTKSRREDILIERLLSAYENGSWADAQICWLDKIIDGAVDAHAT